MGQSSGVVNHQDETFGYLINPAWFQDWIAYHLLQIDPCIPSPKPSPDAFFHRYLLNSPMQYCYFDTCGACADDTVLDPSLIDHTDLTDGPHITGCSPVEKPNVDGGGDGNQVATTASIILLLSVAGLCCSGTVCVCITLICFLTKSSRAVDDQFSDESD